MKSQTRQGPDGRPRIIALGEGMLELSRRPDGTAELAFGGDTLNTALYLARLGQDVTYATALGQDAWSDDLRFNWAAEGLDLRLILEHPDRLPGLYAITTDAAGERSFSYWRESSAAREFFRLGGAAAAIEAMGQADLFYVTGISLSLFPPEDRETIHAIARAVRARGGLVAFDPNYRPRNWTSSAVARDAMEAFAPLVDWALPTFEDEQVLMGDRDAQATLARWRKAGASIVVVKQGREGAWAADATGARRIATRPVHPLDTTGAGDGFNAAVLNALLHGRTLDQAVGEGHALASRVLGHRGAIIPMSDMPPGI